MEAPPSLINTDLHKNACSYCSRYLKPSQRCTQCWRAWASRRKWKALARLENVTTPNLLWQHVVLHCRMRPTKEQRQPALTSLLRSLKRKYDGALYLWVWHEAHDGIHCHLLVGTEGPIDQKWLTGRWRRIQGKHLEVTYNPRDVFCQVRNSPGAGADLRVRPEQAEAPSTRALGRDARKGNGQ